MIEGEVDFEATFGVVNNTTIYMSECSFYVQVWMLDTGSCPSVVDG